MEVSIPIQRPRPQHLSLAFGGNLGDLKSYTASLKPLNSDWITNCRGITSATLKHGSNKTVFDRASLEREFREQIALLKKHNEKASMVVEVDSDNNSSENKNSSSRNSNSRKASPLTGSPSARRAESQDSYNKKEFVSEILSDKIMLVEKDQEIERLQNEIRRLVENKNSEISSLLQEKEEYKRKSEELAEEVDHVRAKYNQLSFDSCQAVTMLAQKDARISSLEAEVRAMVQEQEESHKVFQQMHEAKVLINEFSGKGEQDLVAALHALIEECKQSQESFKESLNNLQDEMTNKNLHIEALISDVNQMKEFIVEHHGFSVFEGEEKEMEAKEGEIKDETEITEATEATDLVDDQSSILVIPEDKEEVEVRTPSNKVTVIIEQPIYRNNSYRNYYGSHYESSYDSNYDRSSYRRRTYNSRPWRDDLVVYQPKTSSQIAEEESRYVTKEVRQEVKESKFEPFKDRKTREEDPVYKQLESMIKELNEKLVANDKKAKKFCEDKLLEASKAQLEKEESLLAEMEKLKDEKKQLLKKIDDMQWEKAYEYTQKAKIEKQEEERALEAANKQKIASTDASKKKKKK